MNGILEVLTQNILPIFLVAGAGFWLRRRYGVAPKAVSHIVFNVFGPCLVFASLVNSQLPAEELAELTVFALLAILTMGALALIVGRLSNMSRPALVTLLITVMFANGGNYGLTFNQLRYGDPGLTRAVVYFTVSTILVYSLGVFIASTGKLSWQASLRRLLSVPALYAVIAALLVYQFEIAVPGPLMRAVEIAAEGAVPTMIIVLGMQMAGIGRVFSWRFAGLATAMRLVVGALVATAIAGLLGLQGLNRSVSILEASMPTAVITTVLATEFDVQPQVTTSIVVLSTLLSPITLALVIQTLGL